MRSAIIYSLIFTLCTLQAFTQQLNIDNILIHHQIEFHKQLAFKPDSSKLDLKSSILFRNSGFLVTPVKPSYNKFIFSFEPSEITPVMFAGAIIGGAIGYYLGSKYDEAYGSQGYNRSDLLIEGIRAGFWLFHDENDPIYDFQYQEGAFRNDYEYYLWLKNEKSK